ncbi:MAG: hypothetical protein JNL17_14380 [Cyclobacteriaceae bacterium]|nr:hypothetical protein [Cyclobacteriaceae bacterium]
MKKIAPFLFAFVLFACSDEEIVTTGDLTVRVNLPGLPTGTPYVLQTEAAYLSGEPIYLKQGTLSSNAVVSFSRLLPGNYVFVIYSANTLTFVTQVIPGDNAVLEARL